MEALGAEAELRQRAEAELIRMRAALAIHTETLTQASREDEVIRAGMGRELRKLRDEIVARDGVILRLREERVRLSLHHPALGHGSDATGGMQSPSSQRLEGEGGTLWAAAAARSLHQRDPPALHRGLALPSADQVNTALWVSQLEAELAESRAKCEALTGQVRHWGARVEEYSLAAARLGQEQTEAMMEAETMRAVVISSRETLSKLSEAAEMDEEARRGEVGLLNGALKGRDAVILRLREELVRFEVDRLSMGDDSPNGVYSGPLSLMSLAPTATRMPWE